MGRWQSSCRRRSVFGCRVSSGSCRSPLSRPLECVEEAGCRVRGEVFFGWLFLQVEGKRQGKKGFWRWERRRTRKKNRAESFSEREDSREHWEERLQRGVQGEFPLEREKQRKKKKGKLREREERNRVSYRRYGVERVK